MSIERLEDALGQVDDHLIEDAQSMREGKYKNDIMRKKRRRRIQSWKGLVAAAACVCLVYVGVAGPVFRMGSGMKDASSEMAVSDDQAGEKAGLEGQAGENAVEGASDKDAQAGIEKNFGVDSGKNIGNDRNQSMKGVSGEIPDSGKDGSGSYSMELKELAPLFPVKLPELVENPFAREGGFEDSDLDAWKEELDKRSQAATAVDDRLDAWVEASVNQYLSGASSNVVYSPVNLFMALSMLGECTGNESQKQVLDLLGTRDVQELRQLMGDVWTAAYRDDGGESCLLANSLWISDAFTYNEKTAEILAKNYYAESFLADMGSDQCNQAFRQWLNSHTGGLLEDYANTQELDSETFLTLASAIYFTDAWAVNFNKNATEAGIFHALDKDVTCNYLKGLRSLPYYKGKTFQAVKVPFADGGGMWILLPEEGVSVDQMMKEDAAMKLLLGNMAEDSITDAEINLSIPAFDVSGELDLIEGLRNMGLTDIFDKDKADFSTITGDSHTGIVNVKDIVQAARIRIDENGCEAAAFTTIKCEAASDLGQPFDFTADRPFLFSVQNADQVNLFTGIINDPS